MITMTQDQLDSVRDTNLDGFCHELTERARTRHGEACEGWDDETLRGKFRSEMIFADEHGIAKRDNLERYADLSIAIGFGFGKTENWATEILKDNFPAEGWKLDKLERAAVFVVRGRE